MIGRWAGQLFAVPLLSGLCFVAFTPTAFAERPTGPLVIGEVAWAGSSKSLADEWVEIWNLSNEPIDLTGYTLSGAGGSEGISLDGKVIAPQSSFLISNYPGSDPKSALAIEPQLVTSIVSLSNEALAIQLLAEDGGVVDQAGSSTLPAGSANPTKASMIRQPDGSWQTATIRDRMDEGVADFGTPGICDGCTWPMPSGPIEPETDTTSTELFVDQLPITSSTETFVTSTSTDNPAASQTHTATTTSVEIIAPVIDTPPPMLMTPTVTTTPTTQTRNVVVEYPNFRLQRIHPAPASGQKEWIEVKLPDALQLDALNGYSLYDSSGRVALFPPADMTLISQVGQIVRIQLTSAKLNNSGDTVELHRPDGSVVERMGYPQTASQQSWMKNAEGTAWMLEGATESPIEAEVSYSPPPETIELPLELAQNDLDTATDDDESSSIRDTPENKITEGGEQAGSVALKKKTTPKTKTPVTKKAPAPKPTETVLDITHDMLTKIDPNIRISIKGTVATKPGILNKNYYVLLSPDGHGLLVRGSSKQPTPILGSTVRVSGTLSLNDDGLSLGVGTKDRWESIDPQEASVPRPVDFHAPNLEDGWSLVEVTGTVREVSASSVTLDLGDAMIETKIKNASGYRASRFKEGDVLRVRGLLDLRGEEPWLMVRMLEDVQIVSHAQLAKPTEEKKSVPDWLPFGAAGITLAMSEGYRKMKKFQHERKERLLAASLSHP